MDIQTLSISISAKSFTSLIFLLIIIGDGNTVPSQNSPMDRKNEPEIWISGYEAVDSYRRLHADNEFRSRVRFYNLFVSKPGSDFVIGPNTFSVDFTCEADYPITWNFPFPEQLHSTAHKDIQSRDLRISNFSNGEPEPKNVRFKSVIKISCATIKFLSVNLTCRSVESKPEFLSSVYIFLNGKTGIEHRGETLKVFAETKTENQSVPPLVLPCRPESPDLEVNIKKSRVDKNQYWPTWVTLPLTKNHLTFDPKVGFVLHRDLLGNHIFGSYRCSISDKYDSTVSVNVIKKPSSNGNSKEKSMNTTANFKPTSFFYGNAGVRLDYSSKPFTQGVQIKCCSGDTLAMSQKLFVIGCRNLLQCQLLKNAIMTDISTEVGYKRYEDFRSRDNSSGCYTESMYQISAIVICKGHRSVDFVDHFVQLFHSMSGGPVVNRSDRILAENLKRDHRLSPGGTRMFTSLTEYETSEIMETATVNQKMVIIVGSRVAKDQSDKIRHASLILLQDIPYYDDDRDYATVTADTLLKSPTTFLEYDRDEYYEGEPMVFMCFGTRFFHADGFHLRVNWENGNATIIKTMHITKRSMSVGQPSYISVKLSGNADLFHGHVNGIDVPFVFTKSVTAKLGMTSIDCWMPQVDSSRWDKSSKKLKIFPSVAPNFEEKREETIYFYLGDDGNSLTCNIKQGLPLPSVIVSTNGTDLNLDAASNETNFQLPNGTYQILKKGWGMIRIEIRFSVITNDHQGVFQCMATNVNGTVTRTINVLVIERTGIILYVSTSIIGLLCLGVTIGVLAKYWCHKKKVSSLPANSKT